MERLKKHIDKQIEFNQGKNFFNGNSTNSIVFIGETIKAIKNIGKISDEYKNVLIDYCTEKCLQEFYRINQYFSYNNELRQELRGIYVELFSSIESNTQPIDIISSNHYRNLENWLLNANPYVDKVYQILEDVIQPITCAEYSAEFQIEILQIDVCQLMEPVLDIGCGKQGILLKYLRSKDIKAFGIDRFTKDSSISTNEDWLEYNYGISQWGTIISNLGFSNHFNHQHLRKDGDFMVYAKKYMDILNSLKIGGRFFYGPSLPFIEKYLNPNTYELTNNKIKSSKFETTIITRIK